MLKCDYIGGEEDYTRKGDIKGGEWWGWTIFDLDAEEEVDHNVYVNTIKKNQMYFKLNDTSNQKN